MSAGREVGGVHGGEPGVEGAGRGEHLDRGGAVGRQHLLVLGRLLGHVGVQRDAPGPRPRGDDRDGRRVDGAHGVDSGTDLQPGTGSQPGGPLGPRVGAAVREAPLDRVELDPRATPEVAGVEQRDPDARLASGGHEGVGHRVRLGVGDRRRVRGAGSGTRRRRRSRRAPSPRTSPGPGGSSGRGRAWRRPRTSAGATSRTSRCRVACARAGRGGRRGCGRWRTPAGSGPAGGPRRRASPGRSGRTLRMRSPSTSTTTSAAACSPPNHASSQWNDGHGRHPARRSTRAFSSGPNHGPSPAAAFSAIRSGHVVAGIDTAVAGWLRPYFNSAWGQVVTPNVGERREVGGRRRPPDEATGGERAHEDHADAEVLGERQDALLDDALVRVVRHLDGGDAPGAHDVLELAEHAGLPVRRGDDVDLAAVAAGLQLIEAGPPRDEVVDLEHLDMAAEEGERRVDLALGRRRRRASRPWWRRSPPAGGRRSSRRGCARRCRTSATSRRTSPRRRGRCR